MDNKPKILFVDDEEHIVDTLRALFKGVYEVYTATSGQIAIDIVKRNRIDVIVSDQRMPEMQGVDLLREVKEISPSTVRILLTGYADFEAIVGSINAGEIFRYIYKPWSNQEVKATLAAAAAISRKLSESALVSAPGTGAVGRLGILVIDDTPDTAAAVTGLFGVRCRISTANSFQAALDVLEKEDIGVIVSDVFVGKQDMTGFIKLLKAEYPSIVTVVLTSYSDANMTVALINQGQIFRYLTKPARQGQLRASIEAALTYHARCKSQPVLLARHAVEKVDIDATAGMSAAIMARLKALRNHLRTA